MRRIIAAALLFPALASSAAAWAVDDLPIRITQRQAATYYRSARPLLEADGAPCPLVKRPILGLVTGGSSPQGGRQQTSLTFAEGATVTVSRS